MDGIVEIVNGRSDKLDRSAKELEEYRDVILNPSGIEIVQSTSSLH
jgi:hypothetical protein